MAILLSVLIALLCMGCIEGAPATCDFMYNSYFMIIEATSQSDDQCTTFVTMTDGYILTAYSPTLETQFSDAAQALYRVCFNQLPNQHVGMWAPDSSSGDLCTTYLWTSPYVQISPQTSSLSCSSAAFHYCAFPSIFATTYVSTITVSETTTTTTLTVSSTFTLVGTTTTTVTTPTTTAFDVSTPQAITQTAEETTTNTTATETTVQQTTVTTQTATETILWTVVSVTVNASPLTTLTALTTIVSTLPRTTLSTTSTLSVTVCTDVF
jgi:hypothetical protein